MVEFRLLSTIGGLMALNIKDREAERLAAEVPAMTGESKTRAVKVALQERRERLASRVVRRDRGQALRRFLEQAVWPEIPLERARPAGDPAEARGDPRVWPGRRVLLGLLHRSLEV